MIEGGNHSYGGLPDSIKITEGEDKRKEKKKAKATKDSEHDVKVELKQAKEIDVVFEAITCLKGPTKICLPEEEY